MLKKLKEKIIIGPPLQGIDRLRFRVFQAVTVVYIVAPTIGEYANYLGNGKLGGSFISSIVLILSTIAVYAYFVKKENLYRAILIDCFVQIGCYSWGVLNSGGIRAEHFFYISLFPVVNGFLIGRKGALYTGNLRQNYAAFFHDEAS